MKNTLDRFSIPLFATALLLCASLAHSQVSVAIAPNPHPKFTDNSGVALSGGFLYTYQAGTTTPLNTYVDATGLVQNANPTPLDATGAPSNGSTQTGIWLANASYKFCAYNSALVQQWCTDNVTSYLGLLNLANLWTFQQTFSLPIIDTQVDNQFVLGSPGNQTTLDFPPPTGNVTLHFPNTADTMVGRATIDALANKTLNSPVINTPTVNGVTLQGVPVQTIGKSATTVTQTGDTSVHTIYTIPIPGGAMITTGQMRITLAVLVNVSAGGPTVTVTYGGTRISAPAAVAAGLASSQASLVIVGGNLGVANSQSWDTLAEALNGAVNFGNIYHQTSVVDSTVAQNLVVTYQGGANSDSITFYRVIVELL